MRDGRRCRARSWGLLLAGALLFPWLPPAGEAEARSRGGLSPGFHHRHRGHGHQHHHRARPHHRHHYHSHYRHPYYGPHFGFYWHHYYYGPISPREYETDAQHRAERAALRGWDLLARERPKQALAVFRQQVLDDEADAVAKLGYALSAATAGELDLGVQGMRRALRTDAEALQRAPIGEAVGRQVRELIEIYHPEDHGSPHGGDAHFMVAALLYVVGDVPAAASAVDYAMAGGDRDPSSLALRDAVERARARRRASERAPEAAPEPQSDDAGSL